MSRLLNHYDRIAVISLPEREDRRTRLIKNLRSCGLAEPEDLTWVDAVDGRKENIPAWHQQGPGAWGCRFSQRNAVAQAQRDGLQNVLILEDDAVFHPRAAEMLDRIKNHLPDDWDQFFLGGQHMSDPRKTQSPLIDQGTSITRTHAYAVHQRIFDDFITRVSDDSVYQKNNRWHVDHHFSHLHEIGQWKAYSPSLWFAGQADGASDICMATLPVRWWHHGNHFWKIPVILASPTLMQHAAAMLHISDQAPPLGPMARAQWVRRLVADAWLQNRLPACLDQLLTEVEVRKVWPSGSIHAHDFYQIEMLCDYPANGLFPHSFFSSSSNQQSNKI